MTKEEEQEFNLFADEIIQKAKLLQSKVDTLRNLYDEQTKLIEVLSNKISYLYGALDLATDEIETAKDMLRSVGQDAMAEVLESDIDYFVDKAKYDKEG